MDLKIRIETRNDEILQCTLNNYETLIEGEKVDLEIGDKVFHNEVNKKGIVYFNIFELCKDLGKGKHLGVITYKDAKKSINVNIL